MSRCEVREEPPSKPSYCIINSEKKFIFAGDCNIIKGVEGNHLPGIRDAFSTLGRPQIYNIFKWCNSAWTSSDLLRAITNSPPRGAIDPFYPVKVPPNKPVAVSLLKGWSVVLWVGNNDLLSAGVHAPALEAAVDQYKKNINAIIDQLDKHEVGHIYIVTTHLCPNGIPFSAHRKIRKFLLDLAEETSIDEATVNVVDIFQGLSVRENKNIVKASKATNGQFSNTRFLTPTADGGFELNEDGYDVFQGCLYEAMHNNFLFKAIRTNYTMRVMIPVDELEAMIVTACSNWDREIEPLFTGNKKGLDTTMARCGADWAFFKDLLRDCKRRIKEANYPFVTEYRTNPMHGIYKVTNLDQATPETPEWAVKLRAGSETEIAEWEEHCKKREEQEEREKEEREAKQKEVKEQGWGFQTEGGFAIADHFEKDYSTDDGSSSE
jgi:hypothetical protein